MKRTMITLMLAGIFLLCGCQPTPEAEVVKSKGHLQEKIEESEDVKVYEETEDRLQSYKEFPSGNKYEINAEVIGQKVESIPIYDIEFVPFEDGAELKARVEAAFSNYHLSKEFTSRESYLQELELYRLYLSRIQSGLNPDTGEPLAEGEEQYHPERAPLAKKYQVAVKGNEIPYEPTPEENLTALIQETMLLIEEAASEEEVLETDFMFEEKDSDKVVNICAVNDAETLSILFQNSPSYYIFWLDNMTLREKSTNYKDFTKTILNREEFADDAEFQKVKQYADEMIRGLGAQDLVLTEIETVSEGNDYSLRYTKNMNTGELREIIPQSYFTTILDSEMPDYNVRWESETFDFTFRGGELYRAIWKNPSRLVKKVENANVLPWEEILAIAEKQLEYIVSPEAGKKAFGADDYSDIVIDRIELGYTKILVEETLDQYQLIPTWNFMGYCTANPTRKICFLTVNAVDGTMVEHKLGY